MLGGHHVPGTREKAVATVMAGWPGGSVSWQRERRVRGAELTGAGPGAVVSGEGCRGCWARLGEAPKHTDLWAVAGGFAGALRRGWHGRAAGGCGALGPDLGDPGWSLALLEPWRLSRSLAAFELTYPSRSLKEVVGIFTSPHYRKSSNLLQRAWLEETGSEPYMQENILGFSPPVTLNWQSRTQASTSQVDSGGLCLQCFPHGNGNSHRPSQCWPSHRNLILESFSRNFSLSALSHGSRTVVPLTF